MLPNTVEIGSNTISFFEFRGFEYCENCHFGGEYLHNPWLYFQHYFSSR